MENLCDLITGWKSSAFPQKKTTKKSRENIAKLGMK